VLGHAAQRDGRHADTDDARAPDSTADDGGDDADLHSPSIRSTGGVWPDADVDSACTSAVLMRHR